MTGQADRLIAARAEVLFTSELATGSDPEPGDVITAIHLSVRRHGTVRACAAMVAGEYGDYPQTAVARMRWALDVVRTVYAARPTGVSPGWAGHLLPAAGTSRPADSR